MIPIPTPSSVCGCAARGSAICASPLEGGTAAVGWADDDADEPWVDVDAAARHVVIWGRRPDDRGRLRSHLTQPDLARLQALLSGY